MDEAVALAENLYRYQLLIESAGIFWLAAELGILVLVRAGRRHVERRPLPPAFRPDARLYRELAAAGVVTVLLCALVYGRHWVDPPAFMLLAGGAMEAAAGAARLAAQERTHLVIWGAFVAGWVVLEVLIVQQGWRGYRGLRRLLSESAR